MLIFQPVVLRASANKNLSVHVRYLSARWAELLDYKSNSVVSAVFRVDPCLWFDELDRTATDYVADDGDRFPMMLDLLKRSMGYLGSRADIGRWYPSEARDFRNEAKQAQPHPSALRSVKQAHVLGVVKTIQIGSLKKLRIALEDPADGYRSRLFAAIQSEIAAGTTTPEAWSRFDDHLSQLAACMLSEGRTGRSLAEATATVIAAAKSDTEAMRGFLNLAQAPKQDFIVGVVLEGAKSVRAPQDYGFSLGSSGFAGASAAVNSYLAKFLKEHDGGTSACGLLIPASAWDASSARDDALLEAQRLQDQLTAEHRLSRFSLNDSVCVYDVSSGNAKVLLPDRAIHNEARAMVHVSRGPLARSLRYNALSRTERSPVIAVLHGWIALENLGAEVRIFDKRLKKMVPGNPASFVMEHVPSVVLLSTAKNMFTGSWLLFRTLGRTHEPARWQQVEQWIGAKPNSKSVDLDKWSNLLTRAARLGKSKRTVPKLGAGDPQADAALYLRELIPNLGPLASRRLDEILDRLRAGTTFAAWSTQSKLLAGINMARLRRLRNEAVHKAVAHQEGAKHLALAGQAVLDSTYEMTGSWLSGRLAWKAVDLAGRRSVKRVQLWSKTAGPLSVSVSSLSGP
jgi:hypothetical protein